MFCLRLRGGLPYSPVRARAPPWLSREVEAVRARDVYLSRARMRCVLSQKAPLLLYFFPGERGGRTSG